MKYEIEGIEKGKTIKSVQVVNSKPVENEKRKNIKVIMVDYLDGTQDVFEFNEETLKNIKNMVDTQANEFISKNRLKVYNFIALITGLFAVIVAAVTGAIVTFDFGWFSFIFLGLTSIGLATISVTSKLKDNSIKKHKIYVSKIMGKLEEYNEILKKENALSKEANKNLIDIINIDNKSVKELEQIGNKIERYNEIEGKSPKKKNFIKH